MQAWCNLQVKLCYPCLSALRLNAMRYINTLFPFPFFIRSGPHDAMLSQLPCQLGRGLLPTLNPLGASIFPPWRLDLEAFPLEIFICRTRPDDCQPKLQSYYTDTVHSMATTLVYTCLTFIGILLHLH